MSDNLLCVRCGYPREMHWREDTGGVANAHDFQPFHAAPLASTDPTPPDAGKLARILDLIATMPMDREHTFVPCKDLQLLGAELSRFRAEHADLVKDRDRLNAANAKLTQCLIDIRGTAKLALAESERTEGP